MKKLFWIIVGIFAGVEIKKQLDKNPEAQAKLDDATKRAREFGEQIAEQVTEGFKERTSELKGKAKPVAKKPAAKKPAAKKPAAKRAPATKPASQPASDI